MYCWLVDTVCLLLSNGIVRDRLVYYRIFFFQAEDGIRDLVRSRGLGDVYKRQLRRFAGSVVSASWDSIVFDVPGQQSLQRIPLNEPLKGTKAQVGWLLERSRDVGELLRDLVGVSD